MVGKGGPPVWKRQDVVFLAEKTSERIVSARDSSPISS